MTNVRFISKSTIRAAVSLNDPTRRIELTILDLQLLLVDPIQKGLLFFKPTPSQEKELKGGSVIDHLKTSLSRTLDIFYPLAVAGRLVMVENNDDKTISFFLGCNNLGAQFVHAVVFKANANAEMGTTTISTLQAVLGHLWRAVVRSRRYSDNQEVHYRVLAGVRQRIQPPLPAEYVGNAVLFGNVTTTVGNLLEHALGWVAWQINKVIASQTAEEVKKYIEDWLKAPKIFKFSGVTSNALITGSSPRFNVYGNDFGWGRPITVRSGLGSKSDGKLTVFPGAEEGSTDFEACLSFETLQTMAGDEEFMEALAS